MLSVFVFSHSLIRTFPLRLINLAGAPLAAGLIAQALTPLRQRRKPCLRPRYHFWRAFCFTLGFLLIRFLYAERG